MKFAQELSSSKLFLVVIRSLLLNIDCGGGLNAFLESIYDQSSMYCFKPMLCQQNDILHSAQFLNFTPIHNARIYRLPNGDFKFLDIGF